MRVRRSLTIKQMAIVSSVAVVTICFFIVIQLFHFVQQRKDDYALQLEGISASVRQPLADALVRGDMAKATHILNQLQAVGILSQADVMLPDELKVLHTRLPVERTVPLFFTRVFNLPVQLSTPLYARERGPVDQQPLAYLVLKTDSYRIYQFILRTLSTMFTAYLLLALILSVSITWSINRLMVHPLRAMARELGSVRRVQTATHQLPTPARHQDDELGMLIHYYNRNQQRWSEIQRELVKGATTHPNTGLPNLALFLALAEHSSQKDPVALLLVGVEDTPDAEQLAHLLPLLKRKLMPEDLLGHISETEFVILTRANASSEKAHLLAEAILAGAEQINIGIAYDTECALTAEQLLQHATIAIMASDIPRAITTYSPSKLH